MTWKHEDAPRFTLKATTAAKKRRWAEAANKALKDGKTAEESVKIGNTALVPKK